MLISIIIRTHKSLNKLSRAIKSAEAQIGVSTEIIIVNDGYSENYYVEDVCNDSCIVINNSEKLKLSGKTLNAGINHASGDYVAILDDDDSWEETKLYEQLKLAKSMETIGVILTHVQSVKQTGEIYNQVWKPKNIYSFEPKILINQSDSFAPPSAALIPRVIFDKIGLYDETLSRGACQDFFRRAARQFPFYVVPKTLTYYEVNPNSLTNVISKNDYQSIFHDQVKRIEKNYDFYLNNKEVRKVLAKQLYKSFLLSGNYSLVDIMKKYDRRLIKVSWLAFHILSPLAIIYKTIKIRQKYK